MEEWHDWLVLRSIPRNVSWSSESVSVDSSMVLMEDWLLHFLPLLVGSLHWSRSWQNSCQVQPEEIWVVKQSSEGVSVVVHHNWSSFSKTSSSSLNDKEEQVEIYNACSSVETLDWKLSD